MCLKTSVDERKRWVEEGRGVLEVWDLQMTLQKVCYKAVVGNVIIHVRWCARVAVCRPMCVEKKIRVRNNTEVSACEGVVLSRVCMCRCVCACVRARLVD